MHIATLLIFEYSLCSLCICFCFYWLVMLLHDYYSLHILLPNFCLLLTNAPTDVLHRYICMRELDALRYAQVYDLSLVCHARLFVGLSVVHNRLPCRMCFSASSLALSWQLIAEGTSKQLTLPNDFFVHKSRNCILVRLRWQGALLRIVHAYTYIYMCESVLMCALLLICICYCLLVRRNENSYEFELQ